MNDSITAEDVRAGARAGFFARQARSALHAQLARIQVGELTLHEAGETHRFGARAREHGLAARIAVHDSRLYGRLMLGGTLAAGEAYVEGLWSCDDLSALARVLLRNEAALGALDAGLARATQPLQKLRHWLRRNTRAGSRRNIAAHYDLGNAFFAAFLDPTLSYSAGIFESPGASMEAASIAKFERIGRKLALAPADRVLEIGSGWGGFAIYTARRFGCHVTTTTISREQFELTRERVAAAGLVSRVDVRLEDYRALRGRFDKLVSIEMVEAVGHAQLDAYFRICSERLEPHGCMLLQAITVPDRRYEASRRSVDFIKRHVFPGGNLPSVQAIVAACARITDLQLVHMDDLTPHYAETLRRWRSRFLENLEAIRGLGCSERFLRLWEFYLCSCEAGFDERLTASVQLLFAKPACRNASVLGALGATSGVS